MDEEMSTKDKIVAWIMITLITSGFGVFAYAVVFLPPGWYLKYLI